MLQSDTVHMRYTAVLTIYCINDIISMILARYRTSSGVSVRFTRRPDASRRVKSICVLIYIIIIII